MAGPSEKFLKFLDMLDEEDAQNPHMDSRNQSRQNAARAQQQIDDEAAENTGVRGFVNDASNLANQALRGTPVGSWVDEGIGAILGDQAEQDYEATEQQFHDDGRGGGASAVANAVGMALPVPGAATQGVARNALMGAGLGAVSGAGNEQGGRLGNAAFGAAAGGLIGGGATAAVKGAQALPSAIDKLKTAVSGWTVQPKAKFNLGLADLVKSAAPEAPGAMAVPPAASAPNITRWRTQNQGAEMPTFRGDLPPAPDAPVFLDDPANAKLILESSPDVDRLYPRIGGPMDDGPAVLNKQANSPEAMNLQQLMDEQVKPIQFEPQGETGTMQLDSMTPRELDGAYPPIIDEVYPDETSLMTPSASTTPGRRSGPVLEPTEPYSRLENTEPYSRLEDTEILRPLGLDEMGQQLAQSGEPPTRGVSPDVEAFIAQQEQIAQGDQAANQFWMQNYDPYWQQLQAMINMARQRPPSPPPSAEAMSMASKGKNKVGQAKAIDAKEKGTYKAKKKEPKKRPKM